MPIPETESEAAKSHRTTKKGVGIQLKEKKILEYSSKICLFPLSLPSFIIGVVSCIYALPPLKSLHSPSHTHEHMVRMIIEIKTWGTSFVDLHPVPAPAHQNALPVGATAASPISRNEPRNASAARGRVQHPQPLLTADARILPAIQDDTCDELLR